ncbi:MAG: PqqD family protein [Gaiellales bacterium]
MEEATVPGTGDESLLAATVRVPEHVVYRAFVKETVVLNLQTGKYHGLNPTGGRMLEVLTKAENIGEATAKLASEYGQRQGEIERDVLALCKDLIERGLIELHSGADR